jgi:hypothetical protein
LMRQQPNFTCMLKNLLKLYCIWSWDTRWYFFVLCCCVWFGLVWFFSPLKRQRQNYFWDTISRIGGWGNNIKIIKTETLLHLNLEIFFNYSIFCQLFIYLFFNHLCLSNACSSYYWYLFISLKLFCLFLCFVVFYFLFLCFSLFL